MVANAVLRGLCVGGCNKVLVSTLLMQRSELVQVDNTPEEVT